MIRQLARRICGEFLPPSSCGLKMNGSEGMKNEAGRGRCICWELHEVGKLMQSVSTSIVLGSGILSGQFFLR